MKNIYLNGESLNEILEKYEDTDKKVVLHLEAKEYNEKIVINNSNITLVGIENKTKIIWNDYAKKIHADDNKPYNTFRTSTVTVYGDFVSFKNITIVNSAGYGSLIGQAVALSVYGNNFLATNCTFDAYQDTIFLGPLPLDLQTRYLGFLDIRQLRNKKSNSIFKKCNILGSVDFIFGGGNSLFFNCNITAKLKGYIAAPSHIENSESGFIFYKCEFESLNNETTILARPWRDYGKVLFIKSNFSKLNIDLNRYNDWDKINYYFYEYPYVKSEFSKRIKKEEIKKELNIFLKK
ncbi:MAG: hypothetical protein LBV51_06000 [Acholeplasmatales bacterium]|jgi:pectinesterase|nr:hypothetical protein [Acholeplasmatales bacterium]